jgi:hypothetical protein
MRHRLLTCLKSTVMRKELEARLKADFPALFRLGCTCDIGDGWEPLFRRLCVDLQIHKQLAFSQLKEKWGALRVYTTGGAGVRERLAEAESESLGTCEKCGEDGRLAATSSGWQFVTCQECLDLRIADGHTASWVEDGATEESESSS